MIIKFSDYIKESLLDKLEGPSEEEVFGVYGDKYEFNSIEEFIVYLFDNVKTERIQDLSGYFNGVVNGIVIFILDINRYDLYISYNIFNICLNYFKNLSTFNDNYYVEEEIKNTIKNKILNYSFYNIKFLGKYEHLFESLLDKLEGPDELEVWKNFGFDRTFTPEEYFHYLTDGIEVISPNGLYYEWKKDGKVVFEQYMNPDKLLFMKYSTVFKIYETIFDMGFREFRIFFSDMIKKYFSQYINMDEYQIRIEY